MGALLEILLYFLTELLAKASLREIFMTKGFAVLWSPRPSKSKVIVKTSNIRLFSCRRLRTDVFDVVGTLVNHQLLVFEHFIQHTNPTGNDTRIFLMIATALFRFLMNEKIS